jgi:phosphoribosylformylglycinamidine cyclo-ligase
MVDQAKANELANFLGLSGYGAVINVGSVKDIVLSTDGVGTKLLVAEHFNKFDTVGIDLVAMCANDILCMGAEPHSFLDYYATGSLDLDKSKEILSGVLKGCELAGCTLVGGETAQLKPMFFKDTWFDLAGFIMGVRKNVRLPSPFILPGDYIVGIPSSGVHSNGFTTLRNNLSVWTKDLLIPTRIYTREILDNLSFIKACAHITGGGIHGNLPRVLNGNKYRIDLSLDSYWTDLHKRLNISTEEMSWTFNCGWGMLLVCSDPERLNIPDARVIGVIE